ncbi:MAG: DUF4382 domain-containing protein [Gammaproteobacteria bacterium]|nr:DUF4382 domain-containing protein [Gammaproteobacteria bacterium]
MIMITRIGLVAVLALGLAACGGGGGSNSGAANTNSLPPTPATVGILITDAHGTRWDQAFATITSIELLGDNYQATIFSGSETIDLLSLPDYFELFATADDVVPGVVEKIRLQVQLLELVELDAMGIEVDRVQTKLVGNGKIDIKPATPITIAGGDTIFVELDFDMEKAFKTIETGSGQIIVRPVIFANVRTDGSSGRLTRVYGNVRSVDTDSLILCQTRLYANHDDDDDDDEERCIVVTADAVTGVFNVDGMPVTFADVWPMDILTAVGLLRHVDDDLLDVDDDVEDDFVLDAVTLEIGDNFDRYVGTAQNTVAGDLFDLLLAPGQGFQTGTVIATELFASTRIFTTEGVEVDLLSIDQDVEAIVDGVIALGAPGTNDILRAALIILDLDVAAGADVLRGDITSVHPTGDSLQLLVGTDDRCIDTSGADIFLISTTSGFVSAPGSLDDLAAGMRADAYGAEGIGGCFIATDVLADID